MNPSSCRSATTGFSVHPHHFGRVDDPDPVVPESARQAGRAWISSLLTYEVDPARGPCTPLSKARLTPAMTTPQPWSPPMTSTAIRMSDSLLFKAWLQIETRGRGVVGLPIGTQGNAASEKSHGPAPRTRQRALPDRYVRTNLTSGKSGPTGPDPLPPANQAPAVTVTTWRPL